MAARSADTRPHEKANLRPAPGQRGLCPPPARRGKNASPHASSAHAWANAKAPKAQATGATTARGPARSVIEAAGADVVMLRVVKLSVVMLSVVMLSVVMLCASEMLLAFIVVLTTLLAVGADVVADAVELATDEPCATRSGAKPAAAMKSILAPNMAADGEAGCEHGVEA
mmetsp:Transcript_23586/g.67097  ORF Transcript_23586/g.67097 Transcript_23586/m.67097 type:complete len:171 (-) Transcript_23586:38-550(-)